MHNSKQRQCTDVPHRYNKLLLTYELFLLIYNAMFDTENTQQRTHDTQQLITHNRASSATNITYMHIYTNVHLLLVYVVA